MGSVMQEISCRSFSRGDEKSVLSTSTSLVFREHNRNTGLLREVET